MADPICETAWADDYGRDHECQEDAGHHGGHECGCGARAPRWLLDRIDRTLAVLDAVRDEHQPFRKADMDFCATCSQDRMLISWPCRVLRVTTRVHFILTGEG